MSTQSPALKSLLLDLRQHPAFPEFLKAVEAPRLPRYRPSMDYRQEKFSADTIYHSGKRDQHDMWLGFLTGEAPGPQTGEG